MALKRKLSSLDQLCDFYESTSSSIDAAAEMPIRKRKRTDSFVKLPYLHYRDWSGSLDQTTAPINERSTEDQNSLQDSACVVEDHGLQEPRSSGVEAVHHSPAGHRVDVTTEGDILSRFEIGKMLGEGSYGSVYEGKRLEDGLEVAVKFVRESEGMEYINIPGHPTPLPLEVGLLILVNRGPKVREIIELLDWQEQPDQCIMVLERPSHCKDVFDFLEDHEGVLNEDTARRIMAQATMAAHMSCRRGVFHSDMKLENLLINTETLEVKLIDFGCGNILKESPYKIFNGTDDYCPPEYNTEGTYHAKPATVWSLGVLLFELVCGRAPKPKDLKKINNGIWSKPGLSNECCHLIRSLLQKNPSRRIGLGKIIFHKWFKPVSKGSDRQERQKRKSSSEEQLPLQSSSSSGQGQKVEDQTTAATSERHAEDETKRTSFIIGQKRKRSSRSAPLYDEAETHPHFCVGEESERPMKKKKRTDSFEQQPSQTKMHQEHAEGDILSRFEIGQMLGEGGHGSVNEGNAWRMVLRMLPPDSIPPAEKPKTTD